MLLISEINVSRHLSLLKLTICVSSTIEITRFHVDVPRKFFVNMHIVNFLQL